MHTTTRNLSKISQRGKKLILIIKFLLKIIFISSIIILEYDRLELRFFHKNPSNSNRKISGTLKLQKI